MSAEPARAYLGIGEVLAQLQAEFPDVSVSKIRFLENEGLIQPARSPSKYRKFSPADVERLRYILTAQRDQYLPLRVIKDQLDAGGQDDSPRRAGRYPVLADPGAGAARPRARSPPPFPRRSRASEVASGAAWSTGPPAGLPDRIGAGSDARFDAHSAWRNWRWPP